MADHTKLLRAIGCHTISLAPVHSKSSIPRSTLGEGTFGKVKLGTHVLTGESVAIKILMKERIKTPADVERVAREIKILKRLSHPSVAELFEVVDTQHHILLVMEHVPDGELFGYICRHKRLSEPVACRLLHDIVDGLDHIHKSGVSHRDLKPENILLQKKPSGGYRCKLIDFGLGNTFRPGQVLKTACGSPCYAAPELVRNVLCEN